MTRYTVNWSPNVEREVANIWLDAAPHGTLDPNQVQRAADEIDPQLCEDASQKGDELSEGLRVLRLPPLLAYFVVHEADRRVEVVMVKAPGPAP